MEIQILEFARLVFGITLVQYFFTMFPPIHFRIVIYILCHDMFEVCGLLFDFDFFRGITAKIPLCISEETLDFETNLRLL